MCEKNLKSLVAKVKIERDFKTLSSLIKSIYKLDIYLFIIITIYKKLQGSLCIGQSLIPIFTDLCLIQRIYYLRQHNSIFQTKVRKCFLADRRQRLGTEP
jgi:hypothetical protein